MTVEADLSPERGPWAEVARFERLARQLEQRGPGSLEEAELRALPGLYRHASSLLARLEASGHDVRRAQRLRELVTRAHGLLYRDLRQPSSNFLVRTLRFLLHESPRAIRAEWKLGLGMLALFYGLAGAAWLAVRLDLEMAFVLFSPEVVANEIAQLRATEDGQPFQGNFTFGLGDSPAVSGQILAHNISVSMIFFAAGLLPPLFLLLLTTNALMLGTYVAVASHWGQAGAISSILWCHGVIELQMIVLAGIAGLVLVRAWIAPGPWSRSHAMALESKRAWALMAPVFPFLFLSGLIEGYVSPHAPFGVRVGTAVGTGLVLVLWIALGGRERSRPAPT